jgi:hypothetical protein
VKMGLNGWLLSKIRCVKKSIKNHYDFLKMCLAMAWGGVAVAGWQWGGSVAYHWKEEIRAVGMV